MYPDFIGIGAQKAGTTWLHRNLEAHPEIHMPRKEVHYFDRKIDDRSNALTRLVRKREEDERWRRQVRHWFKVHAIREPSLRALLWDLKYFMRPYNDRWYASVFEPKKGKVSGEITPAYSAIPRERVAHVHKLMPDAKIVFFMRNPIERVWSHTVMNFDKAEKGSARFVSEKQLLEKLGRGGAWKLSNYRKTLANWGSYYPNERFFVGFLEDMHFFPEALLKSLCHFLGVDPYVDPSLMDKKIHTRSAETMPTRVAVYLAERFREEITHLHERFGGYASFWLHCAERLVENPPEEDSIPYPFWESSMWEEWRSASSSFSGVGALQVQSGPLDCVQLQG